MRCLWYRTDDLTGGEQDKQESGKQEEKIRINGGLDDEL